MFSQKIRDNYFRVLGKLFGLKNQNKLSNAVGFQNYSVPLSASHARLDPDFSYMMLHASFGDKWCILSFVPELFKLHPKIRILASNSDRDLIRVFLGKEECERRIIFLNERRFEEIFNLISDSPFYSDPISIDKNILEQTSSVISVGFPRNKIRHLHIVKYPYFSDLHITHGVPYSTLLKMIMYLPANAHSHSPEFYSADDRRAAKGIVAIDNEQDNSIKVLFNVVNFSHKPLSLNQIGIVIDEFAKNNIYVLLNITQHQGEYELKNIFNKLSNIKIVEIPRHLLPLVCDDVSGIIGVIGGAMNIAAQFSSTPCLSFYTDPLFSHEKLVTAYGGLYGENIWKMFDQGWNCFSSGRYLDNINIGDPAYLKDTDLQLKVSNFCKIIKN